MFGILFLVSFTILFSSQNALGFTLFEDDFSTDPASNGWTENFVGGSGQIVSHSDHSILLDPDPTELNLKKSVSDGNQVSLTITRGISTECIENVQISLEAHQIVSTKYEPKDFLEISIDTNNDGMFETVLKDVEIWEGMHDPDTGQDDTNGFASDSLTSTDFVDLPMGDNNPSLKIRIGSTVNSVDEEYFLNHVEVIGDIIQNCGNVIGGNVLEIDNYTLFVSVINSSPIISIIIGVTLAGIGFVIARKK